MPMTEYEEKSLNFLSDISATLKNLENFFRTVEEMTLGDDDGYLKELDKDRFHPPMG